MKIYVIRHGLTGLNKQKKVNGQIDEPLIPEGIEQAQVATSLIPESVKYIYSSPLQRARYTAEIINSKLNRPISSSEELSEIHMGTLAGYSWNEVLIITHGGIIRLLYLLEQNKVVDETEKHVSLLTFDLDKILKNST